MSEPEQETTEEPAAQGKESWKDVRAEIAQEPGNHGRFALYLSLAVVLLLAAFFVIRLFVMR